MKSMLQIEQLKKFLKNREEVIFAYLFGSEAKGRTSKLSDVDLAVFVDLSLVKKQKHPYGYKATIITGLIGLLKRNDIDLVVLNDSPLFLQYQVVNYGKALIVKDERKRVDFHSKTIDKYLDFKPMLQVQFEYLKKRLLLNG